MDIYTIIVLIINTSYFHNTNTSFWFFLVVCSLLKDSPVLCYTVFNVPKRLAFYVPIQTRIDTQMYRYITYPTLMESWWCVTNTPHWRQLHPPTPRLPVLTSCTGIKPLVPRLRFHRRCRRHGVPPVMRQCQCCSKAAGHKFSVLCEKSLEGCC